MQRNFIVIGPTFIFAVTGPIAGREEQVSPVVDVILQRQAHVTGPLLICIPPAGGEALGALEASAATSARLSTAAAFAEVLPEH